jgi:hypothetical protein
VLFSLRQPPARLFAMICLNIAVRAGLFIVSPWRTATVLDFNILKTTFGKQNGDPGYDDRADITGDQIVSILDFNPMKANFGQGGAPPVMPLKP